MLLLPFVPAQQQAGDDHRAQRTPDAGGELTTGAVVAQEALQPGHHFRTQGQGPDEGLAGGIHRLPDAERRRHGGGGIVPGALLAGRIHLIAMPDGAVGQGRVRDLLIRS